MTQEINIFSHQEEPTLILKEEVEETIPDFLENLTPKQQVKLTIEALLFSSNEAISLSTIRDVTSSIHEFKPNTIKEIIDELKREYIQQQRAFQLDELAEGFILRTKPDFCEYIEQLRTHKKPERLSHAATEVLAIIAYRQPITRGKIDAIRGVDSSGTLQNLQERQLIEAVGKLEAPGRPTLYGITKRFLEHFGLKNIEELPKPK